MPNPKRLCILLVLLLPPATIALAAPAPWLYRGLVYDYTLCPECNGYPRTKKITDGKVWYDPCTRCHGWGAMRSGPCDYCDGSGITPVGIHKGERCHYCYGCKTVKNQPCELRPSDLETLRRLGKISARPAFVEYHTQTIDDTEYHLRTQKAIGRYQSGTE